MNPDGARMHPDEARVNPDEARMHPDEARVNPDETRMHPDEARMHPDDEGDELFGKLDQLISRHQGRAHPPAAAPVPTLTEAVERHPLPREPEIPVLREAVELASTEASPEWDTGERRRQLQVALYLRLRQRLDREFEALVRAREPATAAERSGLVQALQALRNALPAIVRESVDQALRNGSKPD
jgi:hypothetical protein